MPIEELEVYITTDGLGRAAIVRRKDLLLEIYTHWIWEESVREEFNVQGGRVGWVGDDTSLEDLYFEIKPLPGLYQTLDDARSALKHISGFEESVRIPAGDVR